MTNTQVNREKNKNHVGVCLTCNQVVDRCKCPERQADGSWEATQVNREVEEKHNSEYWSHFYLMMSGCEIIDPDGWDRKNYEYSWYEEEITWKEFEKRAMLSTQWSVPYKERLEKSLEFLSKAISQATLAERERVINTIKKRVQDHIDFYENDEDSNALYRDGNLNGLRLSADIIKEVKGET